MSMQQYYVHIHTYLLSRIWINVAFLSSTSLLSVSISPNRTFFNYRLYWLGLIFTFIYRRSLVLTRSLDSTIYGAKFISAFEYFTFLFPNVLVSVLLHHYSSKTFSLKMKGRQWTNNVMNIILSADHHPKLPTMSTDVLRWRVSGQEKVKYSGPVHAVDNLVILHKTFTLASSLYALNQTHFFCCFQEKFLF